jgi:hypothetical protein
MDRMQRFFVFIRKINRFERGLAAPVPAGANAI